MATYYSGNILIESVGLAPNRATLVLGGLGIAGEPLRLLRLTASLPAR